MTIQPDELSRFKYTDIINKDNVITYGLWTRPPVINPELVNNVTDTIRIKIDQNFAGRPDRIAQSVYGTPLLEWIIVMYNRPLNTLGWPKAGTVITIPKKSVIDKNL